MTDTPLHRDCLHCGATFTTLPRQHRKRYCSRACGNEYRRDHPERDPVLAEAARVRWRDPEHRRRVAAGLAAGGRVSSAVPREVDGRRIFELLADGVPRSREEVCRALGLKPVRLHNCIQWLSHNGIHLVHTHVVLWSLPTGPRLEGRGDDDEEEEKR